MALAGTAYAADLTPPPRPVMLPPPPMWTGFYIGLRDLERQQQRQYSFGARSCGSNRSCVSVGRFGKRQRPQAAPTNGFIGAGVSNSVSNTKVGWTAGGGVEWMFLPNWSAKVEYLYYAQ
jgi:hypothetical protein